MSTLILRQKWRIRNASLYDYLRAVRQDGRQAVYRVLPLFTHPGQHRALAQACAWFKPRPAQPGLDEDGCDVGPEQGPHEYVRGSHQRQALDTGAGIPDEAMWQHYDLARTLVITGRAGASFIADTFGIHRGQLPSSGSRLLLSAQYNVTVSPHGPMQPPLQASGDPSFDRYVNRLYLAP
jgi:hypothetical protein